MAERVSKKQRLSDLGRPMPNGVYSEIDIFLTQITQFQTTDTNDKNWGSSLRLWGLTMEGYSVCLKVRDFYPYFYAFSMVDDLEKLIGVSLKGKTPTPRGISYIKSVDMVSRRLLMGFSDKQDVSVYKITMTNTKYISVARNILENRNIPTYEANVLYTLRYMVDMGFGGCSWLRGKNLRPGERETSAQLEYECGYLEVLGDKIDIPDDFRILYFDLEILKVGSGYQGPKVDPIICISNVLKNKDRRVFVYLDDPKKGVKLPLANPKVHVEIFYNEEEMLLAWVEYVKTVDPEIFSGYNVDGYDWNYLFERAKHLKILKKFNLFGRDDNTCKLRSKTFQSMAQGMTVDYELICEGRFCFDCLKMVRSPTNMIKNRSYTLNAMLHKLLGKAKVDLPYELIPKYYNGTDEERAQICYYAWYDSEACLEIFESQWTVTTYVERARICGVPFQFLVTRGQQILVFSSLLRFCKTRGCVVPSCTEVENDEDTAGAKVLDPETGFYTDPVMTLDFGSLYPSIMQYNNICYSTVAPLSWLKENYEEKDYLVPPEIEDCDFGFIHEDIFPGILPQIQAYLRKERNRYKLLEKNAPDKASKMIYNRKQLATKLLMNSLYGFVKANMVCDRRLMSAVTGWGRWMIKQTKIIVEGKFVDCIVIYGDTDSVFCRFIGRTLEKAFEEAQIAADICTDFFNSDRRLAGKEDIHKLEREKGFCPFLLISKKRYSGKKYLLPTDTPKVISSSGMETVRRDNAIIGSGTQHDCLTLIIMQKNVEAAIQLVHDRIADLLSGKIPYHMLIISKKFSKSLKHYEETESKQAHIELVRRIDARKDTTGEKGYVIGDRVNYVIVSTLKGTKRCEAAEDPTYALKNRLSLDYDYYIENQMMKPLIRIFAPILAPSEKLHTINKKGDKAPVPMSKIRNYISYKRLFTGSHMMRRIQTSGGGGLGKITAFTVKQAQTCLHCRVSYQDSTNNGHCLACQDKLQQTTLILDKEMERLQMRRWQCWTKCQSCVGTRVKIIECGNTDCNNYYEREKVLIDIEDLMKKNKI